MGNLLNGVLFAEWWNPFSWPEDISNTLSNAAEAIMQAIDTLINNILQSILEPFIVKGFEAIADTLLWPVNNFSNTTTTLGDVLKADPTSPGTLGAGFTNAFNIIKAVSEKCLLPIAGLLLAYILVKFIYDKVTDSGRSTGEVTSWDLAQILIRIACSIIIVTHAWDIVLAFWQMGTFFVDTTVTQMATVSAENPDLKAQLTALICDAEGHLLLPWYQVIGPFLMFALTSLLLCLVAWLTLVQLYVLILTRMLNFLIYCSFAPVAFATLIDKTWLGNVGQNYIKNLLAFALQAFFLILLINLGTSITQMLSSIGGLTAGTNLTLACIQIVGFRVLAMWIVGKLCAGSMGIAKSMVGAQ